MPTAVFEDVDSDVEMVLEPDQDDMAPPVSVEAEPGSTILPSSANKSNASVSSTSSKVTTAASQSKNKVGKAKSAKNSASSSSSSSGKVPKAAKAKASAGGAKAKKKLPATASRGQTTLGAFFGAVKTKPKPKVPPPPPPATAAVPPERLASLRSIVLGSSGKKSSASSLQQTPQPRQPPPRVTPVEDGTGATTTAATKADDTTPTAAQQLSATNLTPLVHKEAAATPSVNAVTMSTTEAPSCNDNDHHHHHEPSPVDTPVRSVSKSEPTTKDNASNEDASTTVSVSRMDHGEDADENKEEEAPALETATVDYADGAPLSPREETTSADLSTFHPASTLTDSGSSSKVLVERSWFDAQPEDVDDAVNEKDNCRTLHDNTPTKNMSLEEEEVRTASRPAQEVKEESSEKETLESAISTTVENETEKIKLKGLYDTYFAQAVPLFAACQEGLANEVPDMDRALPDEAIADLTPQVRLAVLVEGRSEPLTALVADLAPRVQADFSTEADVSEQIKLLAKRVPLVKDHVPVVLQVVAQKPTPPDIFEDTSKDRFWQWQVTTVFDLMPGKSAAKQRRTKQRKVVSHLHNLVSVLQTVDQLLNLLNKDETAKTKKDKDSYKVWMAKLSTQEEKVLQYQREQAKAALAEKVKEAQRLEREKAKAAKHAAEKAKKEQAAVAKQQATAAKQAAAEAKKEAKRRQDEAKAKRNEELQQKKQAQLHRQQNAMLSFLQRASPEAGKKTATGSVASPAHRLSPRRLTAESVATGGEKQEHTAKASHSFDVETFRSQINSYAPQDSVPFDQPSARAVSSRQRRSRPIQLSVHVTVMTDNPWEARPYADLQQITVRNRYKFLSFDTDVRPPYHGTWSKRSTVISPRNPFAKDRTVFDYDYDSEAEWEEGDEEPGEDIENDAAEDEEEGDEMDGAADEEDDWLAADDDLDDDPDEETKLLRQKVVMQARPATEQLQSFIAPGHGGCPVALSVENTKYTEGISLEEATDVVSTHTEVLVSNDLEVYLDPFPPTLLDEVGDAPSSPGESEEAVAAKMQTFFRFVHHNSTGSKEKLVDDFRTKHPETMNSRAEALRCLESLADKQKHPIKGYIWQVKRDVLEQYDLNDLIEEDNADDPETVQQEILRTLAGHIHQSTHTSKEKLVDDLQATHGNILPSRAETVRHVEALAEKKKTPKGQVYWQVKPAAQRNLGLELGIPDTSISEATVNKDNKRPLDAFVQPSGSPQSKKHKLQTEEKSDTMSGRTIEDDKA